MEWWMWVIAFFVFFFGLMAYCIHTAPLMPDDYEDETNSRGEIK